MSESSLSPAAVDAGSACQGFTTCSPPPAPSLPISWPDAGKLPSWTYNISFFPSFLSSFLASFLPSLRQLFSFCPFFCLLLLSASPGSFPSYLKHYDLRAAVGISTESSCLGRWFGLPRLYHMFPPAPTITSHQLAGCRQALFFRYVIFSPSGAM